MGELARLLRDLGRLFDRRIKTRLIFALCASAVFSLLDMVAVALILPVFDLATATDSPSPLTRLVLDRLGSTEPGTALTLLTIAVIVLFIVKDLGQMAFSWWFIGFVFAERVVVSARLLRHLLTSRWTQVSRRSTAELLRTTDTAVMQVFNYTVNGLMNAATTAIAIFAIVAGLLVVAPLATAVVLGYFGVAAIGFTVVVRPRARRAGEDLASASMTGYRAGLAALGGMKEIILRGSQDHFVDRFQRAALTGAYAGRLASFLAALPKYIFEILFILGVGVVLVTVRAAGSSQGAVAVLAMFVAAGFRVLPSVTSLVGSLASIRVGVPALALVLEEWEEPDAERPADESPADERPNAVGAGAVGVSGALDPPAAVRTGLTVEEVSFRYPGACADTLCEVSLTIPAGEMTALVGGSGAGKTTLADLILGLHAPTSGRILLDGADLAQAGPAWRAAIGYVPQDVYILDATLAENIAFDAAAEDVDRERARRAVAQAQLEDVVRGLPQGLDTELGDRGSRLSGGQRQRVGVARALYRQPRLLVLDEATSALDTHTEHLIARALGQLKGQITLVVIAHRLSTIKDADQVAFLDKGRLAAVGSFEEVYAANADFARLVELSQIARAGAHPANSTWDDKPGTGEVGSAAGPDALDDRAGGTGN